MENLEKWTGDPKIVLAIDVGTVYSAVSFVHLKPKSVPKLEQVSHWSNDRKRAKSLSAIYYDQNGEPRSYGEDTKVNKVKEQAEKEGWVLVNSFKRHVHRLGDTVSTEDGAKTELALPPNVPIESVYSHWLAYLLDHSQTAIIKSLGKPVWDELRPTMDLVFAVPNGWYTQEHGILSRAAISADLVKDDSQICFVPETEAAVHWALLEGVFQPTASMDFLVCDSGGSTTDIALYTVTRTSPLQLQEKQGFPSKCIEAGSNLIDHSFDNMIGQMFVDNGLEEDDAAEVVEKAQESFAKEKPGFDASKETYVFPVENMKETVPEGNVELSRESIAKLYDDQIDKIMAGINELKEGNNPKYLLLLGDFGLSPYFQDKLEDEYNPGMSVVQAGDENIKATAMGALICYLKRSVVARAARYAFGLQILVKFDPNNAEHSSRGSYNRRDGKFVRYGWDQVVAFGSLLKDNQEHKRPYYRMFKTENAQLSGFETTVYTADENAATTKWIRHPGGELLPGFQERCTIKADMSNLRGRLPMKNGAEGPYWYLDYEVAIAFGSTSPEARIIWKEGDKVCSGAATVIPADFA